MSYVSGLHPAVEIEKERHPDLQDAFVVVAPAVAGRPVPLLSNSTASASRYPASACSPEAEQADLVQVVGAVVAVPAAADAPREAESAAVEPIRSGAAE